ncbi:T132C protein, partial [Atractosteus spatula]|nr:T132C protein [Atractosteus spatula]
MGTGRREHFGRRRLLIVLTDCPKGLLEEGEQVGFGEIKSGSFPYSSQFFRSGCRDAADAVESLLDSQVGRLPDVHLPKLSPDWQECLALIVQGSGTRGRPAHALGSRGGRRLITEVTPISAGDPAPDDLMQQPDCCLKRLSLTGRNSAMNAWYRREAKGLGRSQLNFDRLLYVRVEMAICNKREGKDVPGQGSACGNTLPSGESSKGFSNRLVAAESRGASDAQPRFSSLSTYLPVSFQIQNAASSFFLKEAGQEVMRNSSLQARTEPFFIHMAEGIPSINCSYGNLTAEAPVPLELLQSAPRLLPSPSQATVNWKIRAHIVNERVHLQRPRVQTLFYLAGRSWDEASPPENLPCIKVFAFQETQEVMAGCRLEGNLGICVAELELLPLWFHPSSGVQGRKKASEQGEGTSVELYYTVQPLEGGGECSTKDPRKGNNAIRQGQDEATPSLQRIGSVYLTHSQEEGPEVTRLRLDDNIEIWLPSSPVKQGQVITFRIHMGTSATVDQFTLRALFNEGVNFLAVKPSDPAAWDVKQEVGPGSSAVTASCHRKSTSAGNGVDSASYEVLQVDFEIDNFISLRSTQTVTWQVEYPGDSIVPVEAASHVYVSQRELTGIVPLAEDTEVLNTAILTGRLVTVPVKVVTVERDGTVREVEDAPACRSTDEDVIKVSEACDFVLVNGREMRGQQGVRVNFTYLYLGTQLELTVWVPRLPLQIEVSDAELSQVKGWRVPIVANKRVQTACVQTACVQTAVFRLLVFIMLVFRLQCSHYSAQIAVFRLLVFRLQCSDRLWFRPLVVQTACGSDCSVQTAVLRLLVFILLVPTRESDDEEDDEKKGKGCTLQYQHAIVRVLTHFVAEPADPGGELVYMLGSDWQADITELVVDFFKVEDPRIARLQDGRVLIGKDLGITTIQVLSPLSDSILAEKTVTVLDDKVTITDLGVQLVGGLTLALQPSPGSSWAIMAIATGQELLHSSKQHLIIEREINCYSIFSFIGLITFLQGISYNLTEFLFHKGRLSKLELFLLAEILVLFLLQDGNCEHSPFTVRVRAGSELKLLLAAAIPRAAPATGGRPHPMSPAIRSMTQIGRTFKSKSHPAHFNLDDPVLGSLSPEGGQARVPRRGATAATGDAETSRIETWWQSLGFELPGQLAHLTGKAPASIASCVPQDGSGVELDGAVMELCHSRGRNKKQARVALQRSQRLQGEPASRGRPGLSRSHTFDAQQSRLQRRDGESRLEADGLLLCVLGHPRCGRVPAMRAGSLQGPPRPSGNILANQKLEAPCSLRGTSSAFAEVSRLEADGLLLCVLGHPRCGRVPAMRAGSLQGPPRPSGNILANQKLEAPCSLRGTSSAFAEEHWKGDRLLSSFALHKTENTEAEKGASVILLEREQEQCPSAVGFELPDIVSEPSPTGTDLEGRVS